MHDFMTNGSMMWGMGVGSWIGFLILVLVVAALIKYVFLQMSAHGVQDSSLSRRPNWLRGLKVYLAVVLVANLVWEILQLPLYSIWTTGTARKMTFAVIHCTGGDILIALSALTFALIVAGTKSWPVESYERVLSITLALGVGYTIFSEQLNIIVRAGWAYSDLMPVIPIINTGLAPLLQWILVPLLALSLARKAAIEPSV